MKPHKRRASSFWMLRMAWRDGRKSWKRLLLYISATSIGIAALVAAGSLQHNFEEALRRQAKPLLGADVVVLSRQSFNDPAKKFFSSLPYPQLREVELTTVAYFPKKEAGRLLEVRAIEPGFPFYGEMKTDPPGALAALFNRPSVLIEENVMAEFDLTPGDSVELGQSRFQIAGALKMVPGEALASVFSAPRAFIALPFLEETGLARDESLARHKIYFKIDGEESVKKAVGLIEPKSEGKNWRVSTVADRQRSLGRRAGNAGRFLKLAALIALILGGIGVASILFVYARDKWPIAATLKCLGAPAAHALGIFVLQGLFLGAAGTVIGTVLGVALQSAVPLLIDSFFQMEIPFSLSWRAIGSGAAVGFCLTFLFSLLPLLTLRSVSPLAALRANDEPKNSFLKDRAAWVVALLVLLFIFLFAKSQTARIGMAAAVPAGLAGALLLLSVLTRFALRRLRSHMPGAWPFAWRQGLANLFRPNNQTHVLVSALGLGSALIFTISFLNNSLLSHISLSTSQDEPTLALIDIQTNQMPGVREAVRQAGAGVMDEVPFVSMRIEEIKGRPVEEINTDKNSRSPRWALRREYRSTYRHHLGPGERLSGGKWPPAPFSADDAVPVSLEEGIAEDLGVGLGDDIVFNVQGLMMKTAVAALRKVDWYQLRPNFFVVFPENVLEEAPQFTVMMARAPSVEKTGAVQRQIREKFPNVSTVDLRMVLDTLNSYFDKVALALKFMAFFVVATGLMILAGALISGRYERLREAALLRTLGASSRDIRRIHLIEYGLIGFFSGLAGLVLGGAGSFLTAKYVFEIGFQPGVLPAVAGWGSMVFISVATGLFLGRGMLRLPPLETLREDG